MSTGAWALKPTEAKKIKKTGPSGQKVTERPGEFSNEYMRGITEDSDPGLYRNPDRKWSLKSKSHLQTHLIWCCKLTTLNHLFLFLSNYLKKYYYLLYSGAHFISEGRQCFTVDRMAFFKPQSQKFLFTGWCSLLVSLHKVQRRKSARERLKARSSRRLRSGDRDCQIRQDWQDGWRKNFCRRGENGHWHSHRETDEQTIWMNCWER